MAYLSRLRKLEKGITTEFDEIVQLIRQGAYYDQLTPNQQNQYKLYRESLGGVARDLASAELDILINDTSKAEAYHFKLSKRQPPPTKEELQKTVDEISRFFLE